MLRHSFTFALCKQRSYLIPWEGRTWETPGKTKDHAGLFWIARNMCIPIALLIWTEKNLAGNSLPLNAKNCWTSNGSAKTAGSLKSTIHRDEIPSATSLRRCKGWNGDGERYFFLCLEFVYSLIFPFPMSKSFPASSPYCTVIISTARSIHALPEDRRSVMAVWPDEEHGSKRLQRRRKRFSS
jgi:hypothetical protein